MLLFYFKFLHLGFAPETDGLFARPRRTLNFPHTAGMNAPTQQVIVTEPEVGDCQAPLPYPTTAAEAWARLGEILHRQEQTHTLVSDTLRHHEATFQSISRILDAAVTTQGTTANCEYDR